MISVLAGCVGQVPPGTLDAAHVPTQTTLQNCRDFTVQVTVEGEQRQAVGQACSQPGGSWQVTLNAPGIPQQVYALPPETISLYSYSGQYYWDPLFLVPPFFVGGPVFLAHGHRFHNHGGFHHGGSHHGGSHGGRR